MAAGFPFQSELQLSPFQMSPALAVSSQSVRGSVLGALGSVLGTSLAAVWYVVVTLPDAQTVIHRARNLPLEDANRRRRGCLGFLRGLLQAATLPAAAAFALARRRRAARLARLAVLINPPSSLLAALFISETAAAAARLISRAIPSAKNDNSKVTGDSSSKNPDNSTSA